MVRSHPLRWLLALALAVFAGAPAFAAAPGPVVAIGGALRADNDAVWGTVVALAGGPKARFLVVGAASEDPARAAGTAVAILRRHGAQAQFLPLPLPSPGHTQGTRALVEDQVRQIEAATGLFFTGGAQERITAAVGTGRLLAAMQALHRRGGTIAGTSAGAAVMSAHMFADPPATLDVLKGGVGQAHTLGRGLGFAGPGVFVDQHFLRRGRIGRLLPAQWAVGDRLGIGVDEDTAAILHGGVLRVAGSSGALVADVGDAVSAAAGGPFGLRGIRLHLLYQGDAMVLDTGVVQPGPGRTPMHASAATGGGDAPLRDRFFPDILGEGALTGALDRVARGGVGEVIGLAFDPAEGNANPRLGFEFRLSRTPRSMAWSDPDGGPVTVSGVRLDVLPVRMADPLYRPWLPNTAD